MLESSESLTYHGRKKEIYELADQAAIILAHKIGAAAWYECAKQFLTQEEERQIHDLWLTMPGSAHWTNAFFEWMKENKV